MDFDIENFSHRLTVLLDEANMSQTELAKKIGISNVTICRYLTGERAPRIDVLTRIASVFGISVDFLLGISNNRNVQYSSNIIDFNIDASIKKMLHISKNFHLSKKQKEAVEKLLLANKNFILSVK